MKNKFINFILYMILILSLLGYEVNIHKHYSYIQIALFFLMFLAFFLILKHKTYKIEFQKFIKKNFMIFILCFLMLFNTLLSILVFPENNILTFIVVAMYIINILLLFFALPIYFKYNKEFVAKFINIMIILITLTSIFGIILYYNNGIFGYALEGGRSGSIFFDPNFFSIIAALPCVLIFQKKYNKIINILIIIISVIGVYVSGSRGTMLSLCICIVYYILIKYPNKKIILKTLLIFGLGFGLLYAYNFLNQVNFLRLDQGSNGRFELITYALSKALKSPIIGYGYGSVSQLLYIAGFPNSNTHNSFIDFLLQYGFLCLIVYIAIIVKACLIGIKKKSNLCINLMLILLLINMNTIIYSFGGVGLPSMLLSFCLGMTCYGGNYEKNKS